jgi:23S rRNA (cytosine1962-C5)-methyltransferase
MFCPPCGSGHPYAAAVGQCGHADPTLTFFAGARGRDACRSRAAMNTVRLHAGKERSLWRRHPWVFAGSVDKGGADSGDTVRVESADGRFLAWAAYSARSQIRLRAWSFDEAERIDDAFFARRVAAALAMRQRLAIDSDGVRLVHGEADGLPGLIVDRYADTLVVQFLSAGSERHKARIADALLAATGCMRLHERSDSGVRKLEGLAAVTGWLRGSGDTGVTIREHGWRLTLDVAEGHKTGFYLDQRDNRARFAQWVRQLGARRVLNCYCYTGGFSVAALAGGAQEVVSVDSSAPALERARAHVALNGFDAARATFVDADVNATLRARLEAGERFDAIVLDPPKFAPTAAHAERAARAYKDINRLALKLLAPGGLLLTFSCSGGVGAELFHKIVAGAGIDAGVDAALMARLEAAPDHPTTLWFPEGEYLKGLALLRR